MRRLIVLFVVALLVVPAAVRAQSSEKPLSDALDEIGVDWDGWATKSYTIDGLSFDAPYGFAFIGIDLATGSDAEDVVELLPPLFNRLIAESYDDPSLAFSRVSAGQVGSSRYAASADLESDDFEFKIGYLMAQSDHYVVIGLTFGVLISPVLEAAPYVESTLKRLEEEQPNKSKEITLLLPQLDDMPPGYTDDDDTEALSLTPTPSPTPWVIYTPSPPTPTPSPAQTEIHLEGTDTYQARNLSLDREYYRVAFTCSASTGSATITWKAGEDPMVLKTGAEHTTVQFISLPPTIIYSVVITCDGDWTFDMRPRVL